MLFSSVVSKGVAMISKAQDNSDEVIRRELTS